MASNTVKKEARVAVLYIALGRYIVFWKDFYTSCEENLTHCKKHYFVWTDNDTFDFCKNKNVTVIKAQKKGWPYDSLLRFEMFLEKEKEISKCDYAYFFNANLQFIKKTDLAELAPSKWHCGLAAALHPGKYGGLLSDKPDLFPYERRKESTAYIPFGKGKYYACGALNGGESKAFLTMCKKLSKNIQVDLKNHINAVVDDESHLNAYLYDKDFFVLGRQYLFTEAHMKHLHDADKALVKIISRNKGAPKYGGKKWLRGDTDRKIPNTVLSSVLISICRYIAIFIPNRKLRQKVRKYFGSK